ncbi:MAG: hypothetical protein IT285_09135 [Bdellovibrionales bacterium]|nr:hypothetical protein [Bdellovibrionales bacterium]
MKLSFEFLVLLPRAPKGLFLVLGPRLPPLLGCSGPRLAEGFFFERTLPLRWKRLSSGALLPKHLSVELTLGGFNARWGRLFRCCWQGQ